MKKKLVFVGLSLLLVMSLIGFGGCVQNKSLVTLTSPQNGQQLCDASLWQITWQADSRVDEVVLYLRAVDEKYDPEIGRVEAVAGNYTYEAEFLRETDYYLTVHASKFVPGVTILDGQKASHQIRINVKRNPNPVLREDGAVQIKITSPKDDQTLKKGRAYKLSWVYAPGVEKVAIDVPGQEMVVVDAVQQEYLFTIPPYFTSRFDEHSIYIKVVDSKQIREAERVLEEARQAKDDFLEALKEKYGDDLGWENSSEEEKGQYYTLWGECDRLRGILWQYKKDLDRVSVKIK